MGMKICYFLLFVSTFAFGQINPEKLTDITWYKTSTTDDTMVFSSIKRHGSGNYFMRLDSDQSFKMPYPSRKFRRCTVGEKKKYRKGSWSLETIGNDAVLILENEDVYLRYKILYARSGMLKLQRFK
jgi:hypothetical protein